MGLDSYAVRVSYVDEYDPDPNDEELDDVLYGMHETILEDEVASTFITKEQVDEIFKTARDQNYIVELYKLVIPEWDSVVAVNGYPKVNKTTALYLIEKAIAHDKKYTPQVMAGANWGLNLGWSEDDSLEDWEVSMDGVALETEDTDSNGE